MTDKDLSTGAVVARLRKIHGLSQTKLAGKLGVTRQYLCQIENGKEPGMEFLRSVSQWFEIPIAVLLLDSHGFEDDITRQFRKVFDLVLKAAAIKSQDE